MDKSRLVTYFIVKDEERDFQDCIDLLDNNSQPDYLQRNDHRLKLYGSVSGGLHSAQSPMVSELANAGTVVFSVPGHKYTSPDDGSEKLRTDLGFISRLYQKINPIYVFGINNWTIDGIEEGKQEYNIPAPVSDESLANNQIEHPTWLMLFPPEMVEAYGREWLLDLPAEHIEELDDGAIMVVATRDFPGCESNMEIVELIDDAVTPLEGSFQTS